MGFADRGEGVCADGDEQGGIIACPLVWVTTVVDDVEDADEVADAADDVEDEPLLLLLSSVMMGFGNWRWRLSICTASAKLVGRNAEEGGVALMGDPLPR